MDFKRNHKRPQKRKLKERLKLENNMKTKKSNILTLDQFKDKHYGERGTAKRDELESGYKNFKIGALIHEARLEKGLS